MNTKLKYVLVFLIIVLFIFLTIKFEWYKTCSQKGTCKHGDCSVSRFNAENCQRMIDSAKAENKVAFECQSAVDEYIKENKLNCAMNEISAYPLTSQRNKYKCCRTCFFQNETGNDYSKEICKIKFANSSKGVKQ